MRISDWSSDVCSSDLAGAGACVITDAWEGLDLFFAEGAEILVARDGRDVAEMLGSLTPERAREIGASDHAKVLADHSYARRAGPVDALPGMEESRKRERHLAGRTGARQGKRETRRVEL